jgi:predicted component of type VI protein secretion system
VLSIDREGLPALLVQRPSEGLLVLALTDERSVVTLGRHSQSVVTVDWDPQVSRTHAVVERVGRSWYVKDDGFSQNGTFVNGGRLDGRHRLVDGDEIRIGATLVGFRHKNGASLTSTVRASGALTPDRLTPMQMKVLRELCRPYKTGSSYGAPASNQQIADQLCLSLEAVKTHMRGLFERFGVGEMPAGQKRARVVELAFNAGLVRRGEL